MHRILCEIGPLTLYSYGLAFAISFLVGIRMCARRAPAYGFTAEQIYDSAAPVLLAAFVGAKGAYFLTDWRDIVWSWGELVSIMRGGLVYYGGLIGGTAGSIWWLRRRKLSVLAYGDVLAPGMGVALAIGRVGCWLNGCCYGEPVPWAWPVPALGDGVPRHPVQLYEAAGALLLGLTLWFIPRAVEAEKPPAAGSVSLPRPQCPAVAGVALGWFLAGYAILRYVLENFRDDPRGPVLLGLSVSQIISVAGLLTGLILITRDRFRRAR
jgi:phosphatidylglycerol:prolipoprotein diacylglycerol transferase